MANTKGIKRITIPLRPNEVERKTIEPYIKVVFDAFNENACLISDYYSKYCLNHSILGKTRKHNDTEINNIVLVPDLKAFVDWKTGYTFGNPIKYAQNKENDTDDIHYLNKYVRSARQRAVDKEVGKWAYATGVGYYFIEPQSKEIDIEVDAPYVLYHRDSDTCTKVYSSFGGNEPLFDLLYTTYTEIVNNEKKTVKVIDIYLPKELITYHKRELEDWKFFKTEDRGIAKPLPLVEKRFNDDGIGIIAMGERLQDAIDTILSNGLDSVEETVNKIFVYKNVNMGATPEEQAQNHQKAVKNGAVVLNGGTPDAPPDIDVISTELKLGEVKELYAIINEKFHSSLGVPMEMSGTNSGGTTKSGSEVANGYDNAYNHALDDINTMIVADTELLEKILWICKNTAGNKINNLSASEIEIKYSLNLTDNILTKTQSYVNLVNVGVPPTIALRMCKLSNDPEAEGKIIEDYIKMSKESAEPKVVDENIQVTNSQE